jgi:hypothetical protein
MTRHTTKRIILILLLLSLLSVTNPLSVQAAGGVVGDGTPASCTETALKSAVAGNKVITFNCGSSPVTILLNSEILINTDRIIYGDGKITLDGQGKTRLFHVVPYRGLMVTGMTLKNGKATNSSSDPSGKGQGGAIFVDVWSDLTIQNVTFLNNQSVTSTLCAGGGAIRLNGFNYAEVFDSTFTGNTAPNGGAIFNLTADLVVQNSLFDSNQATATGGTSCTAGGGAIAIDGAGPTNQGGTATILITYSTFRNNQSWQAGGAIFSFLYSKDTLTIDRSIFEGNQALFTQRADGSVPTGAGMGGALCLDGSYASPTRHFSGKYVVTNSTLSGNHADYSGGAIQVARSTLEMTNATIANNAATNSKTNLPSNPWNRGAGGAIWIYMASDSTANGLFRNVTIAGNQAGYIGGGIAGYTEQSTIATRLQNSIVANNTDATSNPNCQISLIELGGNVQYPTGGAKCTSGITTADVKLGSLGNNGGLTKTVPLQSGSAAIDHGVVGCPPVDQRGYARNGVCDSGAYEYNGIKLLPSMYTPLVMK